VKALFVRYMKVVDYFKQEMQLLPSNRAQLVPPNFCVRCGAECHNVTEGKDEVIARRHVTASRREL
jgi:hypothetical protein